MAHPSPAPYCGAPPASDHLWSRWNLDPILIGILAAAAVAFAWRARRARIANWRRASFFAGWAAAALALISPLCPLSVALFSARVGQHMFLASICAPLVALGRPWKLVTVGSPGRGGLWAAAAFAVALWFWHAPGPYDETFHSTFVYWAMHLTLFGSAVWLWACLLEEDGRAFLVAVAATAFTAVQMGVLGALITYSARPLYAWHLTTTWSWGLSPLADQQLGGVLMWAPSGIFFVCGFASAFLAMMRRAGGEAIAAAA